METSIIICNMQFTLRVLIHRTGAECKSTRHTVNSSQLLFNNECIDDDYLLA